MSDDYRGVVVVGDTTIDLYPVDGTSITLGSQFEWHIGGTATNVARWAASLGSETSLVTNIGTDAMRELAAQHLTEISARLSGPESDDYTVQVRAVAFRHYDRDGCCVYVIVQDNNDRYSDTG